MRSVVAVVLAVSLVPVALADPEAPPERFTDCMARRKQITDQAVQEGDLDARAKLLASLPHCVRDNDDEPVAPTCQEQRSAAIAEAMKERDPHERGLKLNAIPKCKAAAPVEAVAACPYVAAYEDALAEHRRGVGASCTGVTSDACDRERSTVMTLAADLERCRAGEPVGAPHAPAVLVYVPPPEHRPPFIGFVDIEAGGPSP